MQLFILPNITFLPYSDNSLRITLWGERAIQFAINDIYDEVEPKAIIIIFVGCLPKRYQGLFP